MRIPPNYHTPAWRRFFASLIIGGTIGFLLCLFLLGESEEHHLHKIREQEVKIQSLVRDKDILLKDQSKKNKALEKKMTVQGITVNVDPKKPLLLDRLVKIELERQITDQLSSLINNNLSSVAENSDLIFKTIENHTYTVNDLSYSCFVQRLVIYTDCIIDITVASNS